MRPGTSYPGISVVFLCHDGAGRILLGQRGPHAADEPGVWSPSAGAVELGERLEDAIRREAREELCVEGIEDADIRFLGFRQAFRQHAGQPTHWLAFDYLVHLRDASAVQIGEPHKQTDLRWFAPDALPQPLHSQWNVFWRHEAAIRSSIAGGGRTTRKKLSKEYAPLYEAGLKTYELRLGDEQVSPGDILELAVWDNEAGDYTGQVFRYRVGHSSTWRLGDLPWTTEQINKHGLQTTSLLLL